MTGLEGLLAGRILGDRYRIEEVIGRGGMGAVYRAVDERLGREVAVKVVTATGALDVDARERLRARFQREARAAAALPHHPNVVPVYDYGTDPTLGLDYIVMELLRGNDLATRLSRSGPPPLAAGLRILYEAARGVAVGHRAGLIHRDVKPGNLFLAEHHGEVQVRVLDFGIAKLIDDQDTLSQLTQDGRAPHSPAYASPEQLRGLGQLTPASDVFSLGAVGYQLLTGERPFTDTDRNQMSLGMPANTPHPRELNPAIPEAIAQVLEKALAFDPLDRFPDAGVMAGELGQALRFMADVPLEPYLAAPASPGPQSPGAVDDDRTQLADGDDRTMLAPPPVGAGSTPPRGAAAPVPPRPLPPPPLEPERKRSWGSIVVWSLVLLVLAAAGIAFWTESEPRRTALAPDSLEQTVPPPPDSLPEIAPGDVVVAESLGTSPELDAYVQNQEGLRLLGENNVAAALEQFRLARELSPENPDYGYNFAYALLQANQFSDAAREFQRVIDLDPGRAGAHYNLGLAQLQLGDTIAAWNALSRVPELTSEPAQRAAAIRRMQEIERAQNPSTPRPDTATTPRPDTAAPRDTARAGEG